MDDRSLHLSKKFDVFIFDWDGTLNSLRMITWVNEAVKRALGLWNRDSAIKDFKSMNYNLRHKIEVKEEYKNGIMSILADLLMVFSKPVLHKSTMKLLKELKSSGKKIAILSNERGYRLMMEISYLGIADYFDVIVSAKHIRALKPNPTGLKAILHSLKAKPGRAIFIGDMVDDILAAKLAGVASCAVADGFDSHHKLKSMKPDYLFNGIEGLEEAL
jgi:HAD superfamily hydrolase (TIGR01509 family)